MDPTPLLHNAGQSDWSISDVLRRHLETDVPAGARTIETGAGFSTIILASRGCRHDCVTPAAAEVAAIRAECERQDVPLDAVSFHVKPSQDVLPFLPEGEAYDFALIDGGHGFPVPALDWFFLAPRLKVGGVVAIDDVDIWTGAMIVDVLKTEPGWRHEGHLARRTAVFRKTEPFVAREWCDQPEVVRRSRLGRLARKAGNAAELLARGDLAGLRRRLRGEWG